MGITPTRPSSPSINIPKGKLNSDLTEKTTLQFLKTVNKMPERLAQTPFLKNKAIKILKNDLPYRKRKSRSLFLKLMEKFTNLFHQLGFHTDLQIIETSIKKVEASREKLLNDTKNLFSKKTLSEEDIQKIDSLELDYEECKNLLRDLKEDSSLKTKIKAVKDAHAQAVIKLSLPKIATTRNEKETQNLLLQLNALDDEDKKKVNAKIDSLPINELLDHAKISSEILPYLKEKYIEEFEKSLNTLKDKDANFLSTSFTEALNTYETIWNFYQECYLNKAKEQLEQDFGDLLTLSLEQKETILLAQEFKHDFSNIFKHYKKLTAQAQEKANQISELNKTQENAAKIEDLTQQFTLLNQRAAFSLSIFVKAVNGSVVDQSVWESIKKSLISASSKEFKESFNSESIKYNNNRVFELPKPIELVTPKAPAQKTTSFQDVMSLIDLYSASYLQYQNLSRPLGGKKPTDLDQKKINLAIQQLVNFKTRLDQAIDGLSLDDFNKVQADQKFKDLKLFQ